MSPKLLALAIAAAAALSTPFAARAQVDSDQDFSGAYIIEALPVDGTTNASPKCMTLDTARAPYGVHVARWGGGGLCGIGDPAANLAARRTVWNISTITHTDGRKAYTIRSLENGECLIRGHNAKDLQPTTNLWGPSNAHCGFPTPDAAIENGQATWLFDEEPTIGGTQVTSLRTPRNGPAFLSFASMEGNLAAGSALLNIDHGFRFVRIPDSCTTSGAMAPDRLRVCGVGEFAQPMRVEDAGNLGLPFDSWNATAGMGMGDLDKHYVAVASTDAQAYCNRLRTGSYNDWRVPTGAELLALYNAFPNNELQTRFGWSSGVRPHQSLDVRAADGRILAVQMYNGNAYWERATSPFPVACVR